MNHAEGRYTPQKPIHEHKSIPLSITSVKFVDTFRCGVCGREIETRFVCCPYCTNYIDWGNRQ